MTIDDTAADAGAASQQNPADSSPAQQQQGKIITQAEIDSIVEERLGRDRRTREEALARELGMPLKDVKALIKSRKEEEEAKKTELERLTGERDTHRSEAQAARLEAAKLRALVKAGADPEKIDALIKRVVGSTPEEIEADVSELKALGLLGGVSTDQSQQKQQATGAGNPGLNASQIPPDLDTQIRELELKAIKSGDMRDWARVNKLKAKKYVKS